jgi:nucleotide-binding universal stress UspA family protein
VSIHRILVPIDGSSQSLKAAEVAAELAGRLKARITLLIAVEPPEIAREYVAAEAMEEIRRGLSDAADAMLATAAARVQRPGVEVRKRLVTAPPVSAITAAAEAGQDLIVMASRGLGMHPTERHLLGSVAEGVLRRAACPVLVLPDHGEASTDDTTGSVHETLRRQLENV